MFHKRRTSVFLSLTLILVAGATVNGFDALTDPSLVAWWSFDEGAGVLAADGSGNGNDGTVQGDATWVPGVHGQALAFNGSDTYVSTEQSLLNDVTAFTLAGWVSASHVQTYAGLFGQNDLVEFGFTSEGDGNLGTWMFGNDWVYFGADYAFPYPSWHHVAFAGDASRIVIYIDGQEQASDEGGMVSGTSTFPFTIGGYVFSESLDSIQGEMDDVWVFNRALTQSEIQILMRGTQGLALASEPLPADGAADVSRDAVLTWSPGNFADQHDVYFGTDYQDVNSATVDDGAYQGRQGLTTYTPDRLALGETYYWRIDEVNAPPDQTVYRGSVWSFTTEPVSYAVPMGAVSATASSMAPPQDPAFTIDGSGLSANDEHGTFLETMWLGANTDPVPWIQYEFNQLQKLDRVRVWNHNSQTEAVLGFGIRDALITYTADGENWMEFGSVELAQASGLANYTGVDVSLDGITAKVVRITAQTNWSLIGMPQKGLSEVRFYTIPMRARQEVPVTGTSEVQPLVTLNWRAGREAGRHEVRMGTDPQMLIPVATVETPRYTASVDLDSTLYWQVNEINNVTTPTVWEGDLWSFDTTAHLSVDDMESYQSEEGHWVWETWSDGFDDDSNGAILGHSGNDMETEIYYAGSPRQSLPYYYGQDGAATSEAFREIGYDWGQHGIVSLSLMFHGQASNTPGQMYITVNDTEIAAYPTSSDLRIPQWQAWTIDLPASLGMVDTLAIGVRGGTGLVFIDAIRLYARASETITPETPSDADLLAYYPFEGDYSDASGNGLDGTPIDNPSFLSDPVRGQVLSLDGFAACVDLGASNAFNPEGSFSISVWANIADFINDWGHALIGKRGEDNLGWQLRRYSNTPNLTFTLRGTARVDDPQGSVSMEPFYGEWVHMAAVYDYEGGQRAVYVNGRVDVSLGDADPVAATDHNVYIGARATGANDGPEAFFNGMLDEIQIYRRALSQAEALGLAGRQEPIYRSWGNIPVAD